MPAELSPEDTTAPAGTLREAIESAHRRLGHSPAPTFSEDGGVSVFDDWGRSARLQPLGARVRITLADRDGLVSEGEVDEATLVSRLADQDSVYGAIADVLDVENGPGHRSG